LTPLRCASWLITNVAARQIAVELAVCPCPVLCYSYNTTLNCLREVARRLDFAARVGQEEVMSLTLTAAGSGAT